jgi:hypothetical protein
VKSLIRPRASAHGQRQLKDLPGPRGLPLLGNLLQLDVKRVHTILEQWADEYGDFYKPRSRWYGKYCASRRLTSDHPSVEVEQAVGQMNVPKICRGWRDVDRVKRPSRTDGTPSIAPARAFIRH